ncbi:MAG: hypothetical protein WCP33_08665 [Deltaproteobacteria bacterium]
MMISTDVERLMPLKARFIRGNVRIAVSLLLLVSFLSGCAVTSTTVMDEEVVSNEKPMSSFKMFIIKEFELKRELYTDLPEARFGERERQYARIPAQLADQIQRYVRSRYIFKEVSRDAVPTAAALVLNGKFTRMGRFRISVEAVLLDGGNGQEVAYFRQTLWDVIDTTDGIGKLGREIADFVARIQYK